MKKDSVLERTESRLGPVWRTKNMPHRRPVKRGSFGGRFDDLVKQFPRREGDAQGDEADRPDASNPEERHINERLFESAWRKARRGAPPKQA
jgi:hypothetical protein